jgi:O-antigen ligase
MRCENITSWIPVYFLPVLFLVLAITFGEIGGLLLAAMLFTCIAVFLIHTFRNIAIGLAIVLLGLAPWNWGFDIGGLPKVFADEFFFILYALYFIPAYILFKNRRFFFGQPSVSVLFVFLILVQALSFLVNETDYLAVRNYSETILFGLLLYVVFCNETDHENLNIIINSIIFTAVVLSLGSILEWVADYNPIMEQVDDILYLSPKISHLAGGVYRPYATFFHPSENGTFIAVCLPLAYFKAASSKKIISWNAFMVVVLMAAIVVNYTRGVWLAVLLGMVIFNRPFRRVMIIIGPLLLVMALLLISLFHDVPFIKRLTDPTNLMAREFYWNAALEIFKENPWLGVGHMNYKDVYLSVVSKMPYRLPLDISQVKVADSVYLTILTEFGSLGFGIFLLFWLVVLIRISRMRRLAKSLGRVAESDAIFCCFQAITVYLMAGLMADVHHFTKATKLVFILLGLAFSRNHLPGIYSNSMEMQGFPIEKTSA